MQYTRKAAPLLGLAALTAFGLAVGRPAAAQTYVLTDVGTYTDYTDPNTADTFTGDGFSGYYPGAFAHLLGLEGPAYSRTALQVDISGLAGETINSAVLSFDVLDGLQSGGGNVTLTSFDSNGQLGYLYDQPASLGQTTAAFQHGHNAIDVTALLQDRVASGADYFGLQMESDTPSYWTYTYGGYGYGADRADMRLTVGATPATPAAVPEPSQVASLSLGALGLLGLMFKARRRKAGAAA